MLTYAHIFSHWLQQAACLFIWAYCILFPLSICANNPTNAFHTVTHEEINILPANTKDDDVLTNTAKRRNKTSTRKNPQNAYTNELMQKVFNYVKVNELDNTQYNSDVYLRHFMHTKRRGPIVRYIPDMLRLERGINNYLSEVRLRFQYRDPGQIDCKIAAYHSTAPYQPPQRFNSIARFNFFIYNSKLFLDCILNPLHKRNRRFYHYEYKQTTTSVNSRHQTASINIIPRFTNDQLVNGNIIIDTTTGAVNSFKFKFHYHLRHYTVTAHMEPHGYGSLLPYQMRVISSMKLLGNYVYEVADMSSSHTFSCPLSQTGIEQPHRYDLTQQCLLRIDTTRIVNSIAYFDSIRPYPLGKIGSRIIEKNQKAQLLKKQNLKSKKKEQKKQFSLSQDFLQVIDNPELIMHLPEKRTSMPPYTAQWATLQNEKNENAFAERTQKILLSSHQFNLGNHSRIKLPAIITPSMIGWSRNKGLSLKTRIRWEYYKPHQIGNRPFIEVSPSIGYSFKQKQIYWDIPLSFRFLPKYDGLITIRAGGGDHMYNSQQADELLEKLEGVDKYDSLVHIINHYGFHDYRDSHIQTDFNLSIIPGLRFTLGTRYHRRSLINWNKLANATGLKRHFSSIGPRIQIEWTPAQYYYRDDKRCIPLYSKYPTIFIGYERGYALGKGQTHYERFEVDVRYRLALYAMRSLYFRAGLGVYTQRGTDCFLDYDYFRFSYMPNEWKDDMTGEIQLLSSRWYNESRYYVRFNGSYESPMLLLSRAPLISKIIQKERVYFNMLSVKALNFYTEMGYGISTHLIDFGLFMGIAPDHSFDIGCKIALRFFDN